jgi:peptide/nickel transport system substrate-binding protein
MSKVTYLDRTADSERSDQRGDTERRGFLKGLGVLGFGSIASLTGLAGGDRGTQDRTEVHDIEMWGPTPQMGTNHQTAKLAYETMAEELPLPIEFVARKHSRSVEDAFFNHDFTGWYSMFTLRPERVDPHALLVSHLMSSNTSCGAFNISEYSNDAGDELFDESAKTIDRDERQTVIRDIQERLATVGGDVPFSSERGLVFPVFPQLWNSTKFGNITEVNGLGIRNIWTFNEAQPKTDDTEMVVVLTTETSNLNPLISGAGNRSAVRNVYDNLTRMGPDGEPKPWLAEDWSISDDNRTFTFTVRSGHAFHDGEPLTAEDVAFSYRYHRERSPYFGSGLQRITNIEQPDDTTVRFTLEEPFAPIFTFVFNRIPVLPQHIWQDVPENVDAEEAFQWSPTDADAFVGSGHMEFVNWRKGGEIQLTKNPDHWRPPNLDGLLFNVVSNTQSILTGLQQGQFDMLWQLSGADPSTLVNIAEQSEDLSLKRVLSTGSRANIMNTKTGPFSFEEVRAAVESVVPKQTIVNEVWEGLAEEGHGQYSAAVPFWYNDNQKKWGASYTGKEEAMSLLEERGFTFEGGTAYYPEGEAPPEQLDGYGC